MKKKIKRAVSEVKGGIGRLSVGVTDRLDLKAAESVDISNCRSVCLALGPYRNLTTLTAATLFLHPDCQVLNHAGGRIYGNPELDFITSYSKEKFDLFVKFAARIARKGRRGDLGGSITASHAFDEKYAMKEAYRKSGVDEAKSGFKCLFWKESLITANHIREQQTDLGAILDQEPRLRFLLPIRHPLDCAVSNIKTDHAPLFQGLEEGASLHDVTGAILDEIAWFAACKADHPKRFFEYWEHTIGAEMLADLAAFLDLEPDKEWIDNALSVMDIQSQYTHDPELWDFYREQVEKKFADYPDFQERLLAFCPSEEA